MKIDTPNLMETLLTSSLKDYRSPSGGEFRGCYIDHAALAREGVTVSAPNRRWPILVLSGTSLPVSCSQGLLAYILRSGFEVATIENPIGGPFDIRINPKRERPAALRAFLGYLKSQGVSRITAVAQSYSSFELIRTLLLNPGGYRPLIPQIVFINAPGLDPHIGYIRHVMRFLWGHTIRGYAANAGFKARDQNYSQQKELSGICVWAGKTLQNTCRSLREVKDIVTYKTKEPIRHLARCGFDVNYFLQANDQLVPAGISLRELDGLLPESHIKYVPGGHNDLYFQDWQRPTFVGFLKEIRARGTADNDGNARAVLP